MEQDNVIENKLKAFPLYMASSGCDYHRIMLPFLYGGEHFDENVHQGFRPELLPEFLSNTDVVVYNRHFALGVDWLNGLREKHGFKIVVDLDDWLILPSYHPQYKHYREVGAKMIIDSLKNADCVTVTTDRLYQKVKEFNKNTHVIPNALPFGHGQFAVQPERKKSDVINFIYAGQSSHLEDVRLMHAAINKAKNLPVLFTLAGYSQKSPTVWKKIEQVFSQHPNYWRIDSRPLKEYMTVYDGADCSLVPLCINEFNSCKSNLKMLEAGAKKIPCIVSHVPPYRDDVDAPVLWVKSPGDWYKHFKYLVENPNAAIELGEALHDYVSERYNLFKWNYIRFGLYESLVK